MDRYDIVCVHTIVGFAPAHQAHFSVRADGLILQSRNTKYRSAANLNGNHRIIAIENEDHGDAFGPWNVRDGHAVPALTGAQVGANAKILAWAHETHGIPLQISPNSRSTSRGLGYHRQGIDGNYLGEGYKFPGRVPGGEVWSESDGKVCPGDRRISQLPQILSLAEELVNGDEMTPDEYEAMLVDAANIIKVDLDKDPDTAKWSLQTVLQSLSARIDRIDDKLDRLLEPK